MPGAGNTSRRDEELKACLKVNEKLSVSKNVKIGIIFNGLSFSTVAKARA
jgi:hypothetical protein